MRALDLELSPEATAGLRPAIVESWRRTLATGLEGIDPLPSIEADASETRERWGEHPLGLLRHVLAEPLQMLAEESNSLVQVTDASGLTLYLGGAEWLKARAAEMNLVEGARCSETVNGTNGVGTALAAGHPVQVFAFEHFSYHHREWVCSGAPIHDRVSGRLVGVINLSSPWKIAHPGSLELVTARGQDDGAMPTGAPARPGRPPQASLRRSDDEEQRSARQSRGLPACRRRPGAPKATRHSRERWRDRHGRRIARRGGAAGPGRGLSRPPARPKSRQGSTGRGAPTDRRARRASRERLAEPGGGGATLSAYLEAAIDCVIVADASGRIVEFNPAAERTFGYSRQEALGRTIAELIVPPSLRERHAAAFARFVQTGAGSMLGRRVELTGMRADGSEFPIELALSQVEAEPVLICGALRDLSATKQAESHLRELAEEQAALRQVATLVAYESSPERLVAVVVEQVARVFHVPLVRLIRYEPTARSWWRLHRHRRRPLADRLALAARHAGTAGHDPAYGPCRARRGLRAGARRRRWCRLVGRHALRGRKSDRRRRARVGCDRASLAAKRTASRRHGGAAGRLHGSRRDGARERRVPRRAQPAR